MKAEPEDVAFPTGSTDPTAKGPNGHPADTGQPKVSARRSPGKEARVFPHSVEAEEFLLSSCMLDGKDVIPRCLAAGISPRSFYEPKNGILFDCMLTLHTRGMKSEIFEVAEELKLHHQLDSIGGYRYLAQISALIPTTAQAPSIIARVSDYALRRELLLTAIGTAESCYNSTDPADELVKVHQEKVTLLAENRYSANATLEHLKPFCYDPTRRLPDIEPIMSLGEVAICTRGNLSTMTALSKVGKSSALSAVLAALFRDADHGGDCFTFNGLNSKRGAVIHFDTEQHGKDHERLCDHVMRRAGATSLPPWFYSFSRKGASPAQLHDELEALCRHLAKKHKFIHLVALDGIADFVSDVNDPKATNPVVTWLEELTVRYETHIMNILHLNPTTGRDSVTKARGHLGSQLQRKCETDLRLKKDEYEVTTIFTDPLGTRKQPVFESKGPRFKWDNDARMHLTVRRAEPGQVITDPKDLARKILVQDALDRVILKAGKKAFRYGDFITAISSTLELSTKGAEERFTQFKKYGLVSKDIVGYWTAEPSIPDGSDA